MMEELNHEIDGFFVAGGSKRGWVTWFTGVVEPDRVKVIAPVVLDILNMHVSMKHSFMSLGNWSFAFEDFYRENITEQIDSDEWFSLQKIIDPFSYRHKLTNMPKVPVTCSGDPFFLIDDSNYWLTRMSGETHRYLMGNCEHSTAGSSLFNQNFYRSLLGYFRAVANNAPRPEMTWNWGLNSDTIWAELTIVSNLKPTSVNIRYAETVEDNIVSGLHRRDFRWMVPNSTWIVPGEWESDKNQVEKVSEKKLNEYLIRPVKVYRNSASRINDSLYRYETNIPTQGY